MTNGTYLGDDYKFERRKGKIEAFIWGEPDDYEEELFDDDGPDLHYSF